MEQGENHRDTELLRLVNEGILNTNDKKVNKYLMKRLHIVKGRFASPTF